MSDDPANLPTKPEYRATMEHLDRLKRSNSTGVDYWHAREILDVLGYGDWDGFEPVVKRAMEACAGAGITASHHFRLTSVMMRIGKGGQRRGVDYWLSRAACYLVAMNGDPAKAEVAAAQAYFAVQTRRMELEDQRSDDEKRLDLRKKVTQSFKRVSGVAQEAGVRSHMQGIFHEQRALGLYKLGTAEVKARKGLADKDKLWDHAGPLELSAHDFQMNLAAEAITLGRIKGEQPAIRKNLEVALEVRDAMRKSGATMPEDLKLASEPIKVVQKRVAASKKLTPPSTPTT